MDRFGATPVSHEAAAEEHAGASVVVEPNAMVRRGATVAFRRLAVLIVLLGGAVGGCDRSPGVATPAAAPAGPRRVVALGRLEPASGVISMSALPGEQLKRFADGVVENATVAAGAELAWLGSFDLRDAQVAAAETKLDVARQQHEHELAVARAQLEQAIASRAQAVAKLEEVQARRLTLDTLAEATSIAERDVERLVELQADDPALVTDHQLRRQRNESAQARKEYEAAAAAYPAALAAAEKGVEAAEANVALAQHGLALAENVDQTIAAELELQVARESLEQSVLRAPDADDGPGEFTILRILLQPGEFVAQLPVMELGDLSEMVCIAEVYEADAKQISVGQSAVIRSPAFAGPFAEGAEGGGGIPGRVVRVGRMVTSPGLANRNPLAPSDRSIVDVRIAIDPENEAATREASRRVGLQVTVEFGPQP